MLRHSKRCLTQWKPPSRASCRSRAVVLALPHRKTWTAGSIVGTTAPASGEGAGTGETAAAGATEGLDAAVGADALVVGGSDDGAGAEHAAPIRLRTKRNLRRRPMLDGAVQSRGTHRVQGGARR